MALTKPNIKTDALLWAFRVRLAGLIGLLTGGAGAVFMSVGFFWLGLILAVLGGLAVVAALVYEVHNLGGMVAARRGAAGSNVAVQIVLAVGLLLEINAFSFFHYYRCDWTNSGEHTLPAQLQKELAKLRGETTIVVHVSHNFGQISDKRDEYDHAAERVVIDKVEEVAEQLRQLGPQLKVFVLDVKNKRYRDKLRDVVEDTKSKELAKAIQDSTEDSIFILAEKKVQRLGFQDFFQLDKKASRKANDGEGNLVMHYQGPGPLVRRILNLDDRKPRVAVGVIHDILTTQSKEDRFTMAGARKAFADHGFETQDIILKDLESRTPKAIVRTYDEDRYEEYDFQIAQADKRMATLNAQLKVLKALIKQWQTGTLEELSKKFARELGGAKVKDEEQRSYIIQRNFSIPLQVLEFRLKNDEEFRKDQLEKRAALNVGDLTEQRRLTDLKAKLTRKLEQCDLLILPRMTLLDAASGRAIPKALYQLDPAQEAAIQDFLKKGKPVLALFGPTNDPRGMPPDMMHAGQDRLEAMLARLGFRLGRETFLHDVDLRSFGEQRGNIFIEGTDVEVPPVRFVWESSHRAGQRGLITDKPDDKPALRPNPIAESMRLTVAGLDANQNADLRIRFARPIDYFVPRKSVDPTFLMTDPKGWKADNPFRTEDGGPPKQDPDKAGQTSIGVAVEASLPPEWMPEPGKDRVRVAVIGQGAMFTGKQLSPVREKLLLDVCNWLIGRDDMLNRPQEEPWTYPRVEMSNSDYLLWQWAIRLGLPVFFAFLGVVVLMVRAMR